MRGVARPGGADAVPTPPLWVTSAGTMDAIAAVDPEIAAAAFVSDHAIALGGRPGAIVGASWASCARFEADADAGTIGADVRVAMYDPERWRHTPAEEQRDPLAAMARFGDVARRHGYVCMITPHPGLLSIPGSTLGSRRPRDRGGGVRALGYQRGRREGSRHRRDAGAAPPGPP